MKRDVLIILLGILLLGAAATPAGAVPLGMDGGDGGTGFLYMAISASEAGVGFGYGSALYLGENAGVFLEGGEGAYALGAWYEPAESLVVAAKYAYAGGWIYTWYGWDYVAIDGFLLGAYYKFPSRGLFGGPYADKGVALFGAGAVTATDGYYTATAFFCEFQSLSYVSENVAFTTALSFSKGMLVSTLGLAVVF